MTIEKIELTTKEQSLFDDINWDLYNLCEQDYDIRMDSFEKMGQLAESLFKRKAIPKHRIDWFTKPDLNVGGYGKSRYERFVKNSGSANEMVRHPDFMEHMHYFIHGPVLPEETIKGFIEIKDNDFGTSGMVMNNLCAYVRKEIRDKKLFYENTKHDPAIEFFKLALEVKCYYPDVIHKEAKSVKRRK